MISPYGNGESWRFLNVPLSQTDIKNKEMGKENSIDRTSRLFYVTCTVLKSL